MDSTEVFWYAWPWLGLGGAIVMAVVLFATDACRSNDGPRWRDPVWLAWIMPAVFMIHQFEEYGYHVTDSEYDMISFMTGMFAANPVLANASVPDAHYPLMNMVFAWVALSIAALISRHNPVVGFSGYGFALANSLMHVMSVVGMGMPPLQSPGFFTGVFGFVGLFVLAIVAVRKGSFMTGKALAIAIVSGALGHVLLMAVYPLSIVGGAAAVVVGDVVVSFAPCIFTMLASGGLVMRESLAAAKDYAPASTEARSSSTNSRISADGDFE